MNDIKLKNPEDMVTISKSRFDELIKDSDFLACLRNNGVDNWDWYSEACEEFNEQYGEDDE